MSVDGGLTACWIDRRAVVTDGVYCWKRAGRHFWKAPPPPPKRRPVSGAPAGTGAGEAPTLGVTVAVVWPPSRSPMRMPELWRQVWTAACSASDRGAGVAVAVSVSPPVSKVAVWVGTVPVWCSTSWVSPAVAEATPGTFTVCVRASAGKLSSVEDRKKSWVNLVPAGPSFERSVVTLLFSASSAFASLAFAPLRATAAPPPPPGLAAKKPPPPLFWAPLFWGPLLVAVDVATRVT